MLGVPSTGNILFLHTHPLPSQTQVRAVDIPKHHLQALPHLPLLVLFGELIHSYHQHKAPRTKEFQMPKATADLMPPLRPRQQLVYNSCRARQQLRGCVHPRKSKCRAKSPPCAGNPSPREAAGKQQGGHSQRPCVLPQNKYQAEHLQI